MSSTTRALIPEAVRAIQNGDWLTARSRLEAAEIAGSVDADLLSLLGYACHKLDDPEAAHGALDRALRMDGSSIRALLTKADLLAAQGARREANLYYGAVVRGGEGRALSPDLAHGVRRAKAVQERLAGEMRAHLRAELERSGYTEVRSDRRFTHALDLLEGRRQVYPQQPSAFYYPELPTIQFFPRDRFPWLEAVEVAGDDMRSELHAELARGGFAPYLQTVPGMPNQDYPLIDSLDWSSCFLVRDGAKTEAAQRCPRTMAALADVPLCTIPGRSPQIMFSQLRPGAHIRPHTGGVNTRLICHMPLIVPDGCWFRVGNETRSWERDEAWVFDDTIEHEARNEGTQTRVVLIFDVWRPELSVEERELVTVLLQALDAFQPGAAWD
ncbi:MAG TPA: aspartyl/asparaginyl beta-hydroxylase domain-containing protein [Brevundimonas sp.]|jgi:aspartyl/asparaginyl beta-hydroxylase (cupin superfamily)|uniref:aspartyl/asparaginyl beta-hydroxylase domain-containing protein n=1 Tax=Brevundimonas sp. TaxID=1871086 RepID=UPI002DE935E9|nr:aspartyl/asparaginyl beta-hydroxylase domain-containing protein [Brevundimonas sp.]